MEDGYQNCSSFQGFHLSLNHVLEAGGFASTCGLKKTNHSNIINVDKFHWKTADLATLSTMNSQNTGAESQFRSCILRRSTLRYDKGCPNLITHLNAASKCVLHFPGQWRIQVTEALRPRLSRDSLRIHEDWICLDKMPDCAFKCKDWVSAYSNI